jgi:hypothetical protein
MPFELVHTSYEKEDSILRVIRTALCGIRLTIANSSSLVWKNTKHRRGHGTVVSSTPELFNLPFSEVLVAEFH